MTVGEFMTVLKYLQGSNSITVTIDAAAFDSAMEMATGGPEIMSTAQAAMVFGFRGGSMETLLERVSAACVAVTGRQNFGTVTSGVPKVAAATSRWQQPKGRLVRNQE